MLATNALLCYCSSLIVFIWLQQNFLFSSNYNLIIVNRFFLLTHLPSTSMYKRKQNIKKVTDTESSEKLENREEEADIKRSFSQHMRPCAGLDVCIRR